MTNLINNVIEIGPIVLEKVSKVVKVFHNNLPLEKDMMQRHSFHKKPFNLVHTWILCDDFY